MGARFASCWMHCVWNKNCAHPLWYMTTHNGTVAMFDPPFRWKFLFLYIVGNHTELAVPRVVHLWGFTPKG